MRLSELRLQNWKGYRRAQLQVPVTTASRNVVIVRGANGAGKTSLVEAVTLALFGRQGLELIARGQSGSRTDQSYDAFLERALNTGARGRDARMSVLLTFETELGESFSLERVWHFRSNGRLRRDDEELVLRQGDDLQPLELREGADKEEAGSELVSRELLPRNLAPFFVFDGEQLDRLAGRDLEGQVRAASEIVAGAPELRRVASDLRMFARDRRRDARSTDAEAMVRTQEALAELEAAEDAIGRAVEGAASRLAPARLARDELVRRIGALHGDSYASFKALFEEREAHARSRSADQEQLRQALSVDLALALSGGGLRSRAKQQLAAEAALERWENGQSVGRVGLDAFLTHLAEDGGAVLPGALVDRLRNAWEAVWRESPPGGATERRHTHLGESDRVLVERQLDAVSIRAADSIALMARRVEAADIAIADLEMRIARQRGLDEQSQGLADKLRTIQEEIAVLEAEHRTRVQALDAARNQAAPLRQEIGRLRGAEAANAPALRRAERADAYAIVLDTLVAEGIPRSLEVLAEGVTASYKAMAHKKQVETVRIEPDGAVKLLDADGRDVRDQDASAGEMQIFAMALMAAIVSEAPEFPIIMDTPFARLDSDHRANVLRHFSSLGAQLILLAHPAELPSEAIELLGDRFAGIVDVEHMSLDGLSVSRVSEPQRVAYGA